MERIRKKGISLILLFTLIFVTMGNTALAAEKVRLNKTSVTLSVGESITLKLNGSSIKSAKSSNKKVASVNSKGKVTAKKKGKATITITGKNKKKYKCKVTVKQRKVYTRKEIGKLAQKYYERHYSYKPCYNTSVNEDGLYVIQIFEDHPDHIVTLDWYTVNKYGFGIDFFGNPIDLKK